MGSLMISFIDYKLINELYNCKEVCKGKEKVTCKYGGFVNPRSPNCDSCVCPGGYGGKDCSQRPMSACGQELNATKEWQDVELQISNDAPEKYADEYERCVSWIRVRILQSLTCASHCLHPWRMKLNFFL
ncbi:unnamed protein product [Strongylus vulgaris]|uniref:Peptidase M12A domain-containing protein n=1 Tax=Strongylus vulgaris TaxID=40348 RepID=A0A3P7JP40_STRVU|nr:unnamed protein product [Strongylus vulgaris]